MLATLASLALVLCAAAAPLADNLHHILTPREQLQGCPVGNIRVPLAGVNLTVPAGQNTSIITLGRGVQNYTCENGTFVSVGAVANLFDVSCFFDVQELNATDLSAVLPPLALNFLPQQDIFGLPVLIKHFFIDLPGATAASPGFFSASNHVVGAKVGDVKSPINSTRDVDWLDLAAVANQGTLAKSVFRINTAGGQPPTSCAQQGQNLSVEYAAMYWFTS